MPAAEIVALSRHPRCIAIGEAGLDYHYDNSPRDVQRAGVPHAHRGGARERPAARHPRPRRRRRHDRDPHARRWGRAPSTPSCTASPPARRLAEVGVELGFYVSFSGILTFKRSDELREIAARVPARSPARRDRRALPRARAASRPSERAGLCGAHGAGAGRRRRPRRSTRLAELTTANFYRLFGKAAAADRVAAETAAGMTLTVTILGCGSSGGVPRVGSGWGACDPQNPKNRRRRCSILVERAGPGGTTSVLVDTSPDLREQLLDAGVTPPRRGAVHARPCRPHPRHRRPAAARHPHAPAHPGLCRRARPSRVLHERFGYCFETPPGSEYPPILDEHRIDAGAAGERSTGRAALVTGAAVRDDPRRRRRARLPLRRPRLCERRERHAGREPVRRSRISTC